MTTRELRQILTAVDNQDLTVRELRQILFQIDEQDQEITTGKVAEITRR